MMGLVPKPRASGWGKRLSPLSFPQETLSPALSPGDRQDFQTSLFYDGRRELLSNQWAQSAALREAGTRTQLVQEAEQCPKGLPALEAPYLGGCLFSPTGEARLSPCLWGAQMPTSLEPFQRFVPSWLSVGTSGSTDHMWEAVVLL